MDFPTFKRIAGTHWSEYYARVRKSEISVKSDSPTSVLFPSMILFMEMDEYFALELIGAIGSPGTLKNKTVKCGSIEEYTALIEKKDGAGIPLLQVNAQGFSFKLSGGCFAQGAGLRLAESRFPIVETFDTKLLADFDVSSLFSIKNASHMLFQNCLLLNSVGDVCRCKSILLFFAIRKGSTPDDLRKTLRGICCRPGFGGGFELVGVLPVTKGTISIKLMSQFQSIFLGRGVAETTIGDFLAHHPEIIRKAFNTRRFVYEPYLKWIEHDGEVRDTAIRPDFLVERDDGYYDIVDLKLAGLEKRNLTRGQRRRRRFIDFVSEGLAQLSNYDYYFGFSRNREHAKKNYGVTVKHPRLILVIGSEENYRSQEVREALRQYGEGRFTLVDYDTVSRSLLRPNA